MTIKKNVDYGPLSGLIGTWVGEQGMDVAPESDGTEHNPYYEKLVFEAAGDVTNAELQTLSIVHYRQVVQRKSNDEVFHDETGYWMWDAERNLVMQSLTIPRAVSVLAGGEYSINADNNDSLVRLVVNASASDKDWCIIESPFMRQNASTKHFKHEITITGNELRYSETTIIDIYDQMFEHTDANVLQRI